MAPVKKKEKSAPYANKPKAVKAKPTPIVKVNDQGGTYIKGTSYSFDMKTRFHHHLDQLKEEATANGGKAVTATALANKAGISVPFAIKIMVEDKAGTIVHPKQKTRSIQRGMGCKALSVEDEVFLLTLYRLEPSTSLPRYVKTLFEQRGTKVSPATLSRWFNTQFPFKGKKVKTCNVPLDKFKRSNILRWKEYVLDIMNFEPSRLKFGDEKHIKGEDLHGPVRIDPQSGIRPSNKTDGDFRNRYTVVGICGIDARARPVEYVINKYTNDSVAFCEFIDNAIIKGFLLPGDVLILDNAAIHNKAASANLAEFLWKFDILLISLPTRAPELNPIELLWNTLNGRLPYHVFLGGKPNKDAVAIATSQILDAVTHCEVAKYYQHCGYIPQEAQFAA
jgi:transposase